MIRLIIIKGMSIVEYIEEFKEIINKVSEILGKPINAEDYKVVDRGIPHEPKSLPSGMMGVYTFNYNGKFLKIGKAGPQSNARFSSQHYNPKSAQSTLAASILMDNNIRDMGANENNISEWIKNNCRRVDILLDKKLGIFTLELVEAILHYKYEPIYEGFKTQR